MTVLDVTLFKILNFSSGWQRSGRDVHYQHGAGPSPHRVQQIFHPSRVTYHTRLDLSHSIKSTEKHYSQSIPELQTELARSAFYGVHKDDDIPQWDSKPIRERFEDDGWRIQVDESNARSGGIHTVPFPGVHALSTAPLKSFLCFSFNLFYPYGATSNYQSKEMNWGAQIGIEPS